MQPITHLLARQGFTVTDSDDEYTTYRHQTTGATCLLAGEAKRLLLDTLTLAENSCLTITLDTATCRINHLTNHGDSVLTLDEPITLQSLTLNNSTLVDPVMVSRSYTTHPEVILTHCAVENLTLDLPDNFRVYLDRCEILQATVRPTPRPHRTPHSVQNAMHLQFCDIQGNSSTQVLLTTSLKQADLNLIDDTYPTPLELTGADPAGTILNLHSHPIAYRFISKTYLALGCWIGTLDEARTLIEGDPICWPSYDSCTFLGASLPVHSSQVEAARARYRALLTFVELQMQALAES